MPPPHGRSCAATARDELCCRRTRRAVLPPHEMSCAVAARDELCCRRTGGAVLPGRRQTSGVELLYQPEVVRLYLSLLTESQNYSILEAAAGALPSLGAGQWTWSSYIRATGRKERGLPILVELLRSGSDKVVRAVAIALRNLPIDRRNKDLIGSYAMQDLVSSLPSGQQRPAKNLEEDTVVAILNTIHEIVTDSTENARSLIQAQAIGKLAAINRTSQSPHETKAASQVHQTVWSYKDLRNALTKEGWNKSHFQPTVNAAPKAAKNGKPGYDDTTLPLMEKNQDGYSTIDQRDNGKYQTGDGSLDLTEREHIQHIGAFFSRLAEAGLVVNLPKCEFGQGQVTHLGHAVGRGEVLPRAAKVRAIADLPVPETRRQLMRIRGMAGFYRKFIPNFAAVTAPLTELLRKGVKWRWSEECQTALKAAKAILTNKPVLVAPDFARPFCLAVDASEVGIGGVLLQAGMNGLERPVAYFSKKLNAHQKRYSTIETEALALVLAVQHREIYNSGVVGDGVVYSDHNPLSFLAKFQQSNARVLRRSLSLQPDSLDIRHVAVKNDVAGVEVGEPTRENPVSRVVGLARVDTGTQTVEEQGPGSPLGLAGTFLHRLLPGPD